MATTVTNANLTVTLTDSVTLNGQAYGNTNTLTIGAIDEVYNRVVELPIGAFTPLLQLGSTGQGSITAAYVNYIRVTNLDDTNYVNLKIFGTDTMVMKLEAGKSFIMGGVAFDAVASSDIAQAAVSHNTAFVMSGEGTVAPCDVEVFVASV